MRPATDVVGFATAVFTAFERAQAVVPRAAEHSVELAGRSIRVQFASSVLERRFWPALAHLASETPGPPDLSIVCWDVAETGVAAPPSPFEFDDFLARGAIRGHVAERVRVTFDAASRVLTVYDSERKEAAMCAFDAARVQPWIDRTPFRTVFRWWADDREVAFLHASAVADERGGVVLAGASGSGKSTTALTCMVAGWQLVADDMCLVDVQCDPVVYPVYGLAKLEPDAFERLPTLGSLIVDPTAQQLVIDPRARLARSAPLRAMLLPRVVRGAVKSRVVPVSRSDVLRTLVPESTLETVGAGTNSLATLAALLQRIPCDRLELGADASSVVRAVGDAAERAR
jgi:hypothetical protein